jgi:hypothetical protein
MQDGYTQVGAGDSDMRVAGKDLQHNRQTRTADEMHEPVRMVTQSYASGGPMKQMLNDEMQRHKESKMMRLEHLEKHYKR